MYRFMGEARINAVKRERGDKKDQRGNAAFRKRCAKVSEFAPPSSARRWWFRLVAVLAPLVLLGGLELGLRLAGCGYDARFFVPHAAAPAGDLAENRRFSWRFFPPTLARYPQPLLFPARKPPGVYRVFVFGESAAEGDPAPEFGFSRILEVLLRARYPGTRFEVLNVAFTAINSHVVLPIAREAADQQGDLWLVYMGNNEVIGPFGAATVFSRAAPPLPIVRATLALKRTRLGQWCDAVLSRARRSDHANKGWGGMSMFVQNRLRWGEPGLDRVYRSFQRNLSDITRLGRQAGAQVALFTVAVNLRDSPPFASRHRPDLTADLLAQWTALYQAGIRAEGATNFAQAVAEFKRAAQLDGSFADLEFRWARCCLALGDQTAAREHFARARDLDTLRFRADSKLNSLIRDLARQWSDAGVRLLDAERHFAAQTADGIPGAEWFYEHVHFTFAGNYALARFAAQELAPLFETRLAKPEEAALAPWLSEAECMARLAYTPGLQYEIAEGMRRRLEEPVFGGQVDHATQVRSLQEHLALLRGQDKPAARQRAVQTCRQAVARWPEDSTLHCILARALTGIDDLAGAAEEWRQVSRLLPHAALPHFELAELASRQARTNDAIAHCQAALRLDPDHAKSHQALGVLYAQTGQNRAALDHLRTALRLDPTLTKAAESLAAQSKQRSSEN
jgi:tetratricopeptide (TPR) repeat protein